MMLYIAIVSLLFLYQIWTQPKTYRSGRLCTASSNGDITLVEEYLKQGVDISERNHSEDTPLHLAAYYGHAVIVEILLAGGASTALRNEDGNTPLHVAAYRGHKKIAEILLNQSASIDEMNDAGKTPLHYAVHQNHQSIVELLLAKQANPNLASISGDTPLHHSAYQGYQTLAQILIHKGAAVEAHNDTGNTALNLAASQGYQAFAEMLIHKGTAINIMNNLGNTPLHSAAYQGHQEMVGMLLSKGAMINLCNKEGNTPLYFAVSENCVTVVKMLLEREARVHTRNTWGYTPLTKAIQRNNRKMVQLLLQHGAYSYQAHFCEEQLQAYWKDPIIRNQADKQFYTTLLLAGVRPKTQLLPQLLEPVQHNINLIVFVLLQSLQLSKKTYIDLTPSVLQSLPRLLHWVAPIRDKEAKIQQKLLKSSCNTSEDELIRLKHLLFISIDEISNKRLALLKGLQRTMPMELILSIREKILFKALVSTLMNRYFLPRTVADYLIADIMARPLKYELLYRDLFRHDWSTPHELTATQSQLAWASYPS